MPDGDGYPIKMAPEGCVATMKVHDAALSPASINVTDLKGVQELAPYLIATVLMSNGQNREYQIPCSSIKSIYSVRYESAP